MHHFVALALCHDFLNRVLCYAQTVVTHSWLSYLRRTQEPCCFTGLVDLRYMPDTSSMFPTRFAQKSMKSLASIWVFLILNNPNLSYLFSFA